MNYRVKQRVSETARGFAKPKQGTAPRQRAISQRRVRMLCSQIEIDLCEALRLGYLCSEGVYLVYRDEHLPELPEAVKLYQFKNPEDSIRYLGRDRKGKHDVLLAPSLKWLYQIRNFVPNLSFEQVDCAPDPQSS